MDDSYLSSANLIEQIPLNAAISVLVNTNIKEVCLGAFLVVIEGGSLYKVTVGFFISVSVIAFHCLNFLHEKNEQVGA